jgi:succinoglycan biosynthesis transport protein ExoP
MSRNYELMREMDGNQALSSSRSIGPAFIPGERCSGALPRQLAGDLMEDLVQRVFLQTKQKQPRMAVFAAIDHGNGCSQTAASVAAALAANTRGVVCLVEGNFRSPGLPKMLGMTNHHGLTDSLLEEGSIQSFVEPIWSGSLWLLSSGSLGASSPRLLTSERMRDRFVELRNTFDFLIVDAPPLSRYADAIALGQLSDGMVLILEAGSTRRRTTRTAVDRVRSSRIQILGAVLTKGEFPVAR